MGNRSHAGLIMTSGAKDRTKGRKKGIHHLDIGLIFCEGFQGGKIDGVTALSHGPTRRISPVPGKKVAARFMQRTVITARFIVERTLNTIAMVHVKSR